MATGESKSKWSGKGQQGVFPLSDDSPSEVSLSYAGKRPQHIILQTPPSETEIVWQGVNVGNRLYYGNNLPILSNLYHDSDIRGKVQLIYIDPPYATNSVFKSRNQTDAYQDLLGGAQYLEFMRERLIFLRELLSSSGSIYVHLDNKMAFHMKIILDEVFGETRFKSFITRRKCNPKNYTRKTYGNVSDYILFYTKSDDYVWNRPVELWTEEKAEKEYTYTESSTGRKFKKVPIHAPGTRNGATGQVWRGMLPPPGKHWQYTPQTLDEMDARGEIFWSSNGNPRRKIYLDDSLGIPVQDIWWNMRDAHNQNIKITGYPTEKTPDLLKLIIEASSNPGDLVLDCFSGSGTTLAVASQLGRKWIGIDNSPAAISATLTRFAHGTEPMGDFVTPQIKAEATQLSLPFPMDESHRQNQILDFELYTCLHQQEAILPALEFWRNQASNVTTQPSFLPST